MYPLPIHLIRQRIKYFTQEIVIFREDILGKLRRNTLIPPNLDQDEEDITKHVCNPFGWFI